MWNELSEDLRQNTNRNEIVALDARVRYVAVVEKGKTKRKKKVEGCPSRRIVAKL